MYKLINVTGGLGGDAHLIIGKEKTALMDTGMAYCADITIGLINKALAEHLPEHQYLDYIFLSHSHYDHVGALPYLRNTWSEVMVLGAYHAFKVLQRPNALAAILKLNRGGAVLFGNGQIEKYDNSQMKIDQCLTEGDIIDLGDCPIETFETPGHTKCSLTFFVDNDLIVASESTGYTSKCGRVNTTFVNSYKQAVASIQKCQSLNASKIISPHYGLLNMAETDVYWQKCLATTKYFKDFILDRINKGYLEDEILEACFSEFYDDICRAEQPYRAWQLNTLAAINTVKEEFIERSF